MSKKTGVFSNWDDWRTEPKDHDADWVTWHKNYIGENERMVLDLINKEGLDKPELSGEWVDTPAVDRTTEDDLDYGELLETAIEFLETMQPMVAHKDCRIEEVDIISDEFIEITVGYMQNYIPANRDQMMQRIFKIRVSDYKVFSMKMKSGW